MRRSLPDRVGEPVVEQEERREPTRLRLEVELPTGVAMLLRAMAGAHRRVAPLGRLVQPRLVARRHRHADHHGS
jgi:hypothetical protein